eukprot:scaffold425_cov175-Amphora_coffeaeformis.AAC.82
MPDHAAAVTTMTGPSPAPRSYKLRVSEEQNARAEEIRLCSFARPHMRALHSAWIAFLTAFFLWFSASPLLSVIQDSLGLSRKDIWLSTICSDISTVIARFVVGSSCDHYGARLPMAAVLVLAAIPTGLLGTVNSLSGLCMARFGVGIAGSSFVMAQYWIGQMFVLEKIGTANAIVAGWGNAGGGLAQVIMGAGLYPLVTGLLNGDKETAWRSIFVVPAFLALVVAGLIVTQSDDAPQGYLKDMKRLGTVDLSSTTRVTFTMCRNAWLLAIAYGCSFGVEISINNAGSLYFMDEFGLGVSSAAAAASTLGLTNLFARALGGILSDYAMKHFGMQGRLGMCIITMTWQGVATLCWSFGSHTLASAIVWMATTSLGIHLTEGAIFGIVPYINPAVAGQMAGMVGMGGNIGGIVFGFCFRHLSYETTFGVMGFAALVSTAVYGGVMIPGQATLWSKETSLEAMNERAADEDKGDMNSEVSSDPPSAVLVSTSPTEPALPTISEV